MATPTSLGSTQQRQQLQTLKWGSNRSSRGSSSSSKSSSRSGRSSRSSSRSGGSSRSSSRSGRSGRSSSSSGTAAEAIGLAAAAAAADVDAHLLGLDFDQRSRARVGGMTNEASQPGLAQIEGSLLTSKPYLTVTAFGPSYNTVTPPPAERKFLSPKP
ncbi:hypothetical protein ACSSS7_000361 [Eimeria intestinalis]